jgi:hypothetical protein
VTCCTCEHAALPLPSAPKMPSPRRRAVCGFRLLSARDDTLRHDIFHAASSPFPRCYSYGTSPPEALSAELSLPSTLPHFTSVFSDGSASILPLVLLNSSSGPSHVCSPSPRRRTPLLFAGSSPPEAEANAGEYRGGALALFSRLDREPRGRTLWDEVALRPLINGDMRRWMRRTAKKTATRTVGG